MFNARAHPIRDHLTRIANVRGQSPALQKGLQLNLKLTGDRAAFYRVFQHDGINQVALVLLNKGDSAQRFEIADYLEPGDWRSALDDQTITVAEGETLAATVPHHGVRVYLLDAPVTRPDLAEKLAALMVAK